MWMDMNDFEWLGIITWWIIRWTSTFWWIEIKNLFSTDGYPMMIMTKFIQNYSPILDTCNVFRGMKSKRFKKISRNSRIFRNMKFRDYSNQDFFHRGKKLATACGEHKLYWFRFNLYAVIFGWKNWLEKYRLILRWCDFKIFKDFKGSDVRCIDVKMTLITINFY